MARNDRTLIAGLLAEHFPTMADATSSDWHGFLNEVTGLDIRMDEDNSTAFDKWRMALAQSGYPVWGISNAESAAMKSHAKVLVEAENERRAKSSELLVFLREEAPSR